MPISRSLEGMLTCVCTKSPGDSRFLAAKILSAGEWRSEEKYLADSFEFKSALRVLPAEIRLTVYRRLRVLMLFVLGPKSNKK